MEDQDNNISNLYSNYSTIYTPKTNRFKNKFNFLRKPKVSLNFKGSFNNIGEVKLPSKKTLLILFFTLLLLIIVFGIFSLPKNSTSVKPATLGESKLQLPDAKAKQEINKEFIFPIRNEKGEEISKIKYLIDNAEKRDEIVVKGQKATSIAGRTYLIINLKIVNEHTQAIQIKTLDYLRLTLNNKENEMLAPDIHNDPVDVQAISTKFTRIGFPINDTDKNLKLHIGEIKGDKTTIDLNI